MEKTNSTIKTEGQDNSQETNNIQQPNPKENTSGSEKGKDGKLFTQDELNDIITKRLNKEKSKWEHQVSEAERLASLSAEERLAEDIKRQQEELESNRKAFEEMKSKYEREQLLNQTSKELSKKSLPISFAELLTGKTAEETQANIESFSKAFTNAVQEEVNNRLKGRVPSSNKDGGLEGTITKEVFRKMSISDKQNLYNTNPELYKSLK